VSKRPNIQSKHEKRVEAEIQAARKKRDRALKRSTAKSADKVEPYITSMSAGPVEGGLPPKVKKWVQSESRSQMRHYRRIYSEVESLAPERNRWVKEFFARISGPRGFSVHAGTRRTLKKSEIPTKPRRKWRLVW